MTTLSAIIPAYNSAQYLSEALRSVLGQTLPVNEIIVVDDCSTDATINVALSFGARVYRTDQNAGAATARNIGIRAARGDLIAFLDSDDLWDADHCETMVALLRQFPKASAAFGPFRSHGHYRGDNLMPVVSERPIQLLTAILSGNFISQSSLVVRRQVLLDIGAYRDNMRYAEDLEMLLRLACDNLFVCAPRITSCVRAHGAQTSASAIRMDRGAWDARMRWLETVRDRSCGVASSEIDSAIDNALSITLREAWHSLDTSRFRAALQIAHEVPGRRALASRWRLRKALWPAWTLAMRGYRRLPKGLRSWVRPWRPPWDDIGS